MFAVGVQCGHFSLRPITARAAEIHPLGAADADAVAQRAAAALHQIKPPLRHVDDDAARLLMALPGHFRAHQAGIDRGDVDRRNDEAAVLGGAIVGEAAPAQPASNSGRPATTARRLNAWLGRSCLGTGFWPGRLRMLHAVVDPRCA